MIHHALFLDLVIDLLGIIPEFIDVKIASAVVGIAISKPLVIGVGVAAAVAGGVLIVTDK